ncbi:glycosyltransferase family 2 protein [bacterium]|nr:glycosyltransferase family 2 protein [bacterium]
MVKKKVAVSILNWNRKEMVLDCIQHIQKLDYPVQEIIVVDNASTDGSVEAVKEKFPNVNLIVNDQNYGTIEGQNICLQRALDTDVEYIYLVDCDIIVDAASLTELVKVADREDQVGLVGTKMLHYHQPDTILSAGGIIDFTQNVTRGRGVNEKDIGQYDWIEEVDHLWGGAILIKREVLERVGLFDPGYIGYWFNDTDLCVRVKNAGYKLIFCPFAKVWHKPHATEEQFSYRKKYLATRNAVRFMKKYATPVNWLKYTFFVFAGLPYMFIRDLILHRNCGGAVGKIHGFMAGLFNKDRTAYYLLYQKESK